MTATIASTETTTDAKTSSPLPTLTHYVPGRGVKQWTDEVLWGAVETAYGALPPKLRSDEVIEDPKDPRYDFAWIGRMLSTYEAGSVARSSLLDALDTMASTLTRLQLMKLEQYDGSNLIDLWFNSLSDDNRSAIREIARIQPGERVGVYVARTATRALAKILELEEEQRAAEKRRRTHKPKKLGSSKRRRGRGGNAKNTSDDNSGKNGGKSKGKKKGK